jgi:hypothetical protein
MRRILIDSVMMVCVLITACYGDEKTVPLPLDVPKIILPTKPFSIPSPPNGPVVISELSKGQLYIIQGNAEIYFRQIPLSLVSITNLREGLPEDLKTSPIIVNGIFVDGDGNPETRIFRGKFLYSVSARETGSTYLMMVPDGAKDADILTQPLTVTGTGPKPPPPKPDPDPTPTEKHVRLSIVTDSENLSLPTTVVLNALVGWNELWDAGSDYRLYDIATTEPAGKTTIEQLNGPEPGLVVTNRDTGEMIHRGPLPTTFADLKTLVGRLTNE